MMRRDACVAAFMIAAIALAGCQTPPMQPMTGAEVRAALIGNTQHGKSVDGEFLAYVEPNLTVHGMFGARVDRGTASISDDGRYCVAWHQTYAGNPVCRTVRRSGADLLFLDDGQVSASVTLTPGNSDNL
jgi:hypothetical protein